MAEVKVRGGSVSARRASTHAPAGRAPQTLREAQHKAIIVARRDAAGRIAMFRDLLRHTGGEKRPASRITLPMTRSDIGAYLNLTLESVSRACRKLSDNGFVSFDREGARIVNRRRFDELVANH